MIVKRFTLFIFLFAGDVGLSLSRPSESFFPVESFPRLKDAPLERACSLLSSKQVLSLELETTLYSTLADEINDGFSTNERIMRTGLDRLWFGESPKTSFQCRLVSSERNAPFELQKGSRFLLGSISQSEQTEKIHLKALRHFRLSFVFLPPGRSTTRYEQIVNHEYELILKLECSVDTESSPLNPRAIEESFPLSGSGLPRGSEEEKTIFRLQSLPFCEQISRS